ncbi:hypothetical protein [Streptomyces bambusae]|uniref:hypothetical protein n=1 Tax=Streptomyces bambusae TaxID=1550616 RepID=UPI001CA5450D|nr:hypothetical protein [Streptomyces bambusae]
MTNSVKHAPGATADVVVRYGRSTVEVEVTNGPALPGRGAAVGSGRAGSGLVGSGSGLIGLDERVRQAGGTFAAGPEATGFTVRAHLPYRPMPTPSPGPGPTAQGPGPGGVGAPGSGPERDSRAVVGLGPAAGGLGRGRWGRRAAGGVLPDERRRASRGLGRTALAAVSVPLVTAVLLFVGLRAWDVLTARQSLLPPEDFARLRIGQLREDIAPLLPDRQTTVRPARPGPFPSGATCEHYVPTADPFDDLSGDVYRLCFLDGRLAHAELFTGKAAL